MDEIHANDVTCFLHKELIGGELVAVWLPRYGPSSLIGSVCTVPLQQQTLGPLEIRKPWRIHALLIDIRAFSNGDQFRIQGI